MNFAAKCGESEDAGGGMRLSSSAGGILAAQFVASPQLTPSARRKRGSSMTDFLLDLIEPDALSRTGRLVAWVAGGLIGVVVAIAALVLLGAEIL